MADDTRSCSGTTKKGAPCKATPRRDTGRCNAHSPKEVQESAGFGGAQEGAGRPRLPRPHEVLRERVEARVDELVEAYFDALEAEKVVVVGSGEFAEAEKHPDHALRLKAADALLDRVYGK